MHGACTFPTVHLSSSTSKTLDPKSVMAIQMTQNGSGTNGSLYMAYSGRSRSMYCGSVSDRADTMYLPPAWQPRLSNNSIEWVQAASMLCS